MSHLAYTLLAGGDAAVKRPYRLALAHLHAAGLAWEDTLPAVLACDSAEKTILHHQLKTGLNSVPTSSMGRLFDAVSALIGVRQQVTYEAQAAIELEAIVDPSETTSYHFSIHDTSFDAAPVISEIAADLRRGVAKSTIAAKFHNAIANLIVCLSQQLRRQTGIHHIALSGGVFQNVTLLEKILVGLNSAEFTIAPSLSSSAT